MPGLCEHVKVRKEVRGKRMQAVGLWTDGDAQKSALKRTYVISLRLVTLHDVAGSEAE